MLFQAPQLDMRDLAVIREIDQMRVELRQDTHVPKKWTGVLRRNLLAKFEVNNTASLIRLAAQHQLL